MVPCNKCSGNFNIFIGILKEIVEKNMGTTKLDKE